MSNLELLQIIVFKLQKKKDWPDSSEWTNREFQILSEEISVQAEITINRNTIRNIIESIHTDGKYNPHITTKDAIASYVGYKNWAGFIKSQERLGRQYLKYLVFFSLALVVVLSVIFVLNRDRSPQFEFAIENRTGTAPYTIVSKYDVKDIKTDNIKLDYGHINSSGQYILFDLDKDKNIHKVCCHYPGDYLVRLFADNKVLFKQKIWINSEGWFVYMKDARSYASLYDIPKLILNAGSAPLEYIPFDAILKRTTTSDGYFKISESTIQEIKNLPINSHLHLKNFKDFGVDLRDCSFTIRFKDEQFGKGVYCHEAAFYLHGELDNMGFKFAEANCNRYTNQRIGTNFIAGSTTDSLDYLILDYKEFTTLKIKSTPSQVQLSVNDKLIKTIYDNQDLGALRGIHLWFKNSPYIDFVEIKDGEGEIVYVDEFD